MSVGGEDDTIANQRVTVAGAALPDGAELIAGRYRILRWLGAGGMGRVYEAFDTELDERVALKVLSGGMSDEANERFRREVRLTRRIRHHNIARMHDIGEHDRDKFLTMELIDGAPLTHELGAAMAWPRLRRRRTCSRSSSTPRRPASSTSSCGASSSSASRRRITRSACR